MTKPIILTTLICLGLSIGSAVTSGLQQSPEASDLARRVAQLPLEPSYILPSNLGEMVSVAQAAVVARVDRTGDIRWETDTSPSGVPIGSPAFASYHVTIEEVLFNKLKTSAPLLVVGPAVLTQRLGREGATEFLAGKQPAQPDDRCLLFLWHRPGSTDWSILQWPLQFRQSSKVATGAEHMAKLPDGRNLLQQQWLGSSVAMNKTAAGAVPQWLGLVAEVKRLSASAKQ